MNQASRTLRASRLALLRAATILTFAGGLSVSAHAAPPNFPKPAPKLPGKLPGAGGKKITPLPPADVEAPAYEIGVATQILASKPRLQILLKTPVPRRHRVYLIEWGGLNRTWELETSSWRKNSITAVLPRALHSSTRHLSERYEVAIYDPGAKKLVSNKVELRPAKGKKAYLSNVEVYAKEILTGRFRLEFDGVNLLPASDRRIQVRLVLPKHPSGLHGLKRTTSFKAISTADWTRNHVETGWLEVDVPQPPNWRDPAYRGESKQSYFTKYSDRVRQEGYLEVQVMDGKNKPVSGVVKVPAKSWIYAEPPKPHPGVDRDRDGFDSIESGGNDCDDRDPGRYPGNTEVPDLDESDEDCDPTTIGKIDRDEDGYLDPRLSNRKHYPHSPVGRDCDDRDPLVTVHCEW